MAELQTSNDEFPHDKSHDDDRSSEHSTKDEDTIEVC